MYLSSLATSVLLWLIDGWVGSATQYSTSQKPLILIMCSQFHVRKHAHDRGCFHKGFNTHDLIDWISSIFDMHYLQGILLTASHGELVLWKKYSYIYFSVDVKGILWSVCVCVCLLEGH